MGYTWLVLLQLSAVINCTWSLVNTPEKLTTVEFVQKNGYPIETHYVTTEDGYILTAHRIPTGKRGQTNGKAVYLQHGLFLDSTQWVLLGPEKALAYKMADAGFDVWMCNARGNEYSRNHTTLDPNSDAFWDFSFHEMGVYDLPAMIDYILVTSNVNGVYYSGHSQGTTSFYIMGSERPEYNSKVIVYGHLAPVAYMSHLTSPVVKVLALLQAVDANILQQIFGPELLRTEGLIANLISGLCPNLVGIILCSNLLFIIFGFSPDKIQTSVLEQVTVQYPSGSSTMQLNHYLQLFNSGYFRQYDRGLLGNLGKYGRTTPPNYNSAEVTTPGYLIYAENDWVSDYKIDVPRIYDELGNCLGKFLNVSASFNHLDYLFSENAVEVYNFVLDLFSKH